MTRGNLRCCCFAGLLRRVPPSAGCLPEKLLGGVFSSSFFFLFFFSFSFSFLFLSSHARKTLALGHALKGQNARWAHGLRKSSEVAKATLFFEPICTGHAKSGLLIFSRNSKTLALGHFFQNQISLLTPGPGKKQILKKSRPFCSARPCCAATSFKFPHHR